MRNQKEIALRVLLIVVYIYLYSKYRQITIPDQNYDLQRTYEVEQNQETQAMRTQPIETQPVETAPGEELAVQDIVHIHGSGNMIRALRHRLVKTVRSSLSGYKQAILLDIPLHENKGDNAITVGELRVLSELNISIVRYDDMYFRKEQSTPGNMHGTDVNPRSTVILAHGGGNLGAYPFADKVRATEVEQYEGYHYVLLSQSTYVENSRHLQYMEAIYANENMTFLLRDTPSYEFSRRHFPAVTSILTPDMAFGIGPIKRFFPPTLDVIWINRVDWEKQQQFRPSFPKHVSYLVTDWLGWETPAGRHAIDGSYLKAYNGFLFLQRGKVLVTDRLHGHIMAALLDIPTVIIDNKIHKITNLRDTWTAGLSKVRLATDAADAVLKAMDLLAEVTGERAPGMDGLVGRSD